MMMFGAVMELIPFSAIPYAFIQIKTFALKHILYCNIVQPKLLLQRCNFGNSRLFLKPIRFKNVSFNGISRKNAPVAKAQA